MNFDHIGEQLGQTLRVFPPPILRLEGQPAIPWGKPLTLDEVNAADRWIQLRSPTGHVVRLWGDNVKGFSMPDILELRHQIVVTGMKVELEPITGPGASAAEDGAERARDVATRAQRLRTALSQLPPPGNRAQADRLFRESPLWDAIELEGFTRAAIRAGPAAAAAAAKLSVNLRYLGDRAGEIRRTNKLLGYDYSVFNWELWNLHWSEADQTLKQLIAESE